MDKTNSNSGKTNEQTNKTNNTAPQRVACTKKWTIN
jgi:hypothetical protein